MNVSFFLKRPKSGKSSSIYARVYDSDIDINFSTGIKVSPENFDDGVPRDRNGNYVRGMKRKPARILGYSDKDTSDNKRLSQIQSKIKDHFISLRDDLGREPMAAEKISEIDVIKGEIKTGKRKASSSSMKYKDVYKRLMDKMANGDILTKSGAKYNQGSLRSTNAACLAYESFAKKYGDLDLRIFNPEAAVDTSARNSIKSHIRDHFTKFREYLTKKHRKNTVTLYISQHKTMLNRMRSLGIIDITFVNSSSNMSVSPENFDVEVIPPDITTDIVKNMLRYRMRYDMKYRKYFDFMVTQLCTAFRFSDVKKLSSRDIEKSNGGWYIRSINQKTGAHTMAKIPDQLASIFQENIQQYGRPVPDTSIMTYNKYLPAILKSIDGMDYEVDRVRIECGERKTVKKDLMYNMVTSHHLRRSAITTMLVMGVPEDVVKGMSGHTRNSASFSRYVARVQSYMDKHIDRYWSKVGGQAV